MVNFYLIFVVISFGLNSENIQYYIVIFLYFSLVCYVKILPSINGMNSNNLYNIRIKRKCIMMMLFSYLNLHWKSIAYQCLNK